MRGGLQAPAARLPTHSLYGSLLAAAGALERWAAQLGRPEVHNRLFNLMGSTLKRSFPLYQEEMY